jgi:hypothetical protein
VRFGGKLVILEHKKWGAAPLPSTRQFVYLCLQARKLYIEKNPRKIQVLGEKNQRTNKAALGAHSVYNPYL